MDFVGEDEDDVKFTPQFLQFRHELLEARNLSDFVFLANQSISHPPVKIQPNRLTILILEILSDWIGNQDWDGVDPSVISMCVENFRLPNSPSTFPLSVFSRIMASDTCRFPLGPQTADFLFSARAKSRTEIALKLKSLTKRIKTHEDTPPSEILLFENHRSIFFYRNLCSWIQRIQPFPSQQEQHGGRESILQSMGFWIEKWQTFVYPLFKENIGFFELFRWITVLHLDSLCSQSPLLFLSCLPSLDLLSHLIVPPLLDLFRDLMVLTVNHVKSPLMVLRVLFPPRVSEIESPTPAPDTVVVDPLIDARIIWASAHTESGGQMEGIEAIGGQSLTQSRFLFCPKIFPSDPSALLFLSSQNYLSRWHNNVIEEVVLKVMASATNPPSREVKLDIVERLVKLEPFQFEWALELDLEVGRLFSLWIQNHSKLCVKHVVACSEGDKRNQIPKIERDPMKQERAESLKSLCEQRSLGPYLALLNERPWKGFFAAGFPFLFLLTLRKNGQSLLDRTVTVGTLRKVHSIPLIFQIWEDLGFTDLKKTKSTLLREADGGYDLFQNIKQVLEKLFPRDRSLFYLIDLLGAWAKLPIRNLDYILQRKEGKGGLEGEDKKEDEGQEKWVQLQGLPMSPFRIPLFLISGVDWLLRALNSRLFWDFWGKDDLPPSFLQKEELQGALGSAEEEQFLRSEDVQKLFNVRFAMKVLFDSLKNASISFERLQTFLSFLLDRKELEIFASLAPFSESKQSKEERKSKEEEKEEEEDSLSLESIEETQRISKQLDCWKVLSLHHGVMESIFLSVQRFQHLHLTATNLVSIRESVGFLRHWIVNQDSVDFVLQKVLHFLPSDFFFLFF